MSSGFLRPTDRVTLNPDAVLADAKADVLAMAAMGYQPPKPRTVKVPGRDGLAALKIAAHTMKEGGYISEYDQHLGTVLGSVLCGGDVPAGTVLSEQDFLDLEREAFVESVPPGEDDGPNPAHAGKGQAAAELGRSYTYDHRSCHHPRLPHGGRQVGQGHTRPNPPRRTARPAHQGVPGEDSRNSTRPRSRTSSSAVPSPKASRA